MLQPTLSSRQRDILALVETEGAQYIEQLAARYQLTTQTIRRDIMALCDLGFARRFHGGVSVPVETRNISINDRSTLNSVAKQRIAQRIAATIEPGSTVFMGIGSTVRYVAAELAHHEALTVVTNNIDVASTLCGFPQVEVHVTGGLLRHSDRDFVGADVLRFFERFYASYAVIGAGALHPENGVLDFSYSEAQITATLIQNARNTILAADVSKWKQAATVKVVPFGKINNFFTDVVPAGMAKRAVDDAKISVTIC